MANMLKTKGRGSKCLHVQSKFIMLHSSATKYWLHRGEDECGWDRQKAAKKWRIGESLKQKSSHTPTGSHSKTTVSSSVHQSTVICMLSSAIYCLTILNCTFHALYGTLHLPFIVFSNRLQSSAIHNFVQS